MAYRTHPDGSPKYTNWPEEDPPPSSLPPHLQTEDEKWSVADNLIYYLIVLPIVLAVSTFVLYWIGRAFMLDI